MNSTSQQAPFLDQLLTFSRLHKAPRWSGSFAQFMEQVLPLAPELHARTAHQYLWDMLRWSGEEDPQGKVNCRLFSGELFGIDESIARIADYFKAAAAGSEVGRRLLLLLGPPSGGKSTLVIRLKRGLQEYSNTEAGAVYAINGCPVHESPLHLIPDGMRAGLRDTYGIDIAGELCPYCRLRLESRLDGDFLAMPVERIFLSEAGRSGIGTYAPHDPSTADLADLVGSVDLSRVAEYGDEGDPRAWSWSGAVYAASRGVLEMIEILKVKREFLYLLLTLTQERNVKVARFPLIYLDEAIIAHTNLAEFRKFLQESENEALLDRMVIVQVPYTFRTLAILQQQRKLGWQTVQLTGAKQGRHQSGPEHEVDGWHFFRTMPSTRWWSRLPVLRQVLVVTGLVRRLRQVARLARPNVLHAHSPSLNALAALKVGKAMGIPVVYEIRAFWEDAAADHGTASEGSIRYRISRALESYVLRRVDAITTICDGLRKDIEERGISSDKITVIPNAVDISDFQSAQPANGMLAQQLGLNGYLVLGFIGSFYRYEGLELLIRAMPAMLAAVPSLQLLLVGGGPQESELRALAQELGLHSKVRFAGRIPHGQVKDYYQLVDLLVYPRLPMRLTELVTPLKPLEAMAQGRLVVASDVGGHRELIEDGKTGVLFKAGDLSSLSERILYLIRHVETWPALRQQARRYVERERNWPASVSRYVDVYQRLAAGTKK